MHSPKQSYTAPVSPRVFCPRCVAPSLTSGRLSSRTIRHGFYYRRSDRAWILRFLCVQCRSTFSRATFHPCYRQKKRQVNFKLWRLLASGNWKRRSAVLLKIDRKTVDRKLQFLAPHAEAQHRRLLRDHAPSQGWNQVQMDEMETFEHTKCKPLSIPLIVESQHRFILGLDVCSMPAKGRLAEISRRKYGPRSDHRKPTLSRVLNSVHPYVAPQAEIRSDSHPFYPALIREAFPKATQDAVTSRRSAITGQGELKKVRWDPIFSLNHTAAMLRANVSRLIRRTWCTTKRIDRLRAHLFLYAAWHNQVIADRLGLHPHAGRPV